MIYAEKVSHKQSSDKEQAARTIFRNSKTSLRRNPDGIYLFKVNNEDNRTMCQICSKLTITTTERYSWRRSSVFIVNFEQILHIVLAFLLLTFNMLGRPRWTSFFQRCCRFSKYSAAVLINFMKASENPWTEALLTAAPQCAYFLLKLLTINKLESWQVKTYLNLIFLKVCITL